MSIFVLMHSAGQDDSDYILGVFHTREAAEETMAAIEAVPWDVRLDDSGNQYEADYASRRMSIEGFGWDYCEDSVRGVNEREKSGRWPPKASIRIEEWPARGMALTVTPKKEPA